MYHRPLFWLWGSKGIVAGRRGRRPLRLKDKVILTAACGGLRTVRPTEQQRKSERGKGGLQPSPDGAGGAEPRPYGHPISTAGVRGRLAAHNERRQPAKLARSCGCLPRGGKHCSLPGFAPLNRGPTLTTPQCPAPTARRPGNGCPRKPRSVAISPSVGRGAPTPPRPSVTANTPGGMNPSPATLAFPLGGRWPRRAG